MKKAALRMVSMAGFMFIRYVCPNTVFIYFLIACRLLDHHPLTHQFEPISTADPLPYYADDDYAGDSHLDEFDYLG
jgi:hypothetical protein